MDSHRGALTSLLDGQVRSSRQGPLKASYLGEGSLSLKDVLAQRRRLLWLAITSEHTGALHSILGELVYVYRRQIDLIVNGSISVSCFKTASISSLMAKI